MPARDQNADTSKVALKADAFNELKVAMQAHFGGSGVPNILVDDLNNAEFVRNCAADAVGEKYPNSMDHAVFGELPTYQQQAVFNQLLLKTKTMYNQRYEMVDVLPNNTF